MMANKARLIDADSLITNLRTFKGMGRIVAETLVRFVEKQPIVDTVEVVHGRWVMKEAMIKSPFAKNAYCSECLEEAAYAHNYCPNCGAKMDGDGDA